MPAREICIHRFQRNAVDWTNRNTQLAACAISFYDGMHAFIAAHNGIGRAGIYAQRATNAPVFVNDCKSARCFYAVVWVERNFCFARHGC